MSIKVYVFVVESLGLYWACASVVLKSIRVETRRPRKVIHINQEAGESEIIHTFIFVKCFLVSYCALAV